jgi:hypothetical protein
LALSLAPLLPATALVPAVVPAVVPALEPVPSPAEVDVDADADAAESGAEFAESGVEAAFVSVLVFTPLSDANVDVEVVPDAACVASDPLPPPPQAVSSTAAHAQVRAERDRRLKVVVIKTKSS